MAVFEKILQSKPKYPFLVLIRNGEDTQFPISQDIVSIGRSNANGIRLDDHNISKRHCLLVRTPDGVKMVDLESTNGTWINDKAAKEQVLRDGDRLRVGPFVFRYADGGYVPPPPTVIPGEVAVGHPFADLLVSELRRTPFWLISLTIHLALILLLWDTDFLVVPEREQLRRITARSGDDDVEALEDVEEETIEEEVPDAKIVVDPDDVPTGDPTNPDTSTEDSGAAGPGLIGLSGRGRGFGDDRGLGLEGLGIRRDQISKELDKALGEMRGRGLDVAILFDSTGSMQGIIDQVRSQISLMNTYIGALVPGNYRLAMVTYRDKNDDYVVKLEPFTRDYYQILIFIEGVNAAGGDDIPEAVYEGLKTAVRKLRWRKESKKVILLFGDAPPHEQELQRCRSVAGRFRHMGGVIHTIFTQVGAKESALDHTDRKTVEAFRSIARYGGGTFNFLDQESQIIKSIQGLIFGTRYRQDVQRLSNKIDFGWKGRHIEKKVRRRDIQFLLRHARRRPLHPLIVDGLIKIDDPLITRELRKIALDPGLPEMNRSAARYVLLRKGIPLPTPR